MVLGQRGSHIEMFTTVVCPRGCHVHFIIHILQRKQGSQFETKCVYCLEYDISRKITALPGLSRNRRISLSVWRLLRMTDMP